MHRLVGSVFAVMVATATITLALGIQAPAAINHPGFSIMVQLGFLDCHTLDGSFSAHGPTLKGVFGSEVKGTRFGLPATVVVDEAYIRQSIKYSSMFIVDGYVDSMPPFDYLKGKTVDVLVSYIKIL